MTAYSETPVAGELFGANARKAAPKKHTPAKTSTPDKGAQKVKSPILKAESAASNKRIAAHLARVKAAHRDQDKTAGNGIDRGAPGI